MIRSHEYVFKSQNQERILVTVTLFIWYKEVSECRNL